MTWTYNIWISNLSILSVPDEVYFRNASYALNKLSTFLFRPFGLLAPRTFEIIWFSKLSTLTVPDEDYSRSASYTL